MLRKIHWDEREVHWDVSNKLFRSLETEFLAPGSRLVAKRAKWASTIFLFSNHHCEHQQCQNIALSFMHCMIGHLSLYFMQILPIGGVLSYALPLYTCTGMCNLNFSLIQASACFHSPEGFPKPCVENVLLPDSRQPVWLEKYNLIELNLKWIRFSDSVKIADAVLLILCHASCFLRKLEGIWPECRRSILCEGHLHCRQMLELLTPTH